MRSFVLASVLLPTALLLGIGKAWAGVELRVGTGSDCDHASIQDAVDAIPNNGSGTIRVDTQPYIENVVIVNKSIHLIGGHNDCAASTPTGHSIINGSDANSPALFFSIIASAGTTHELQVDRMVLESGTGNSLAPGGGLSVSTNQDTTADVILQDTRVLFNNTEFGGGGIALVGDGNGNITLSDNSRIVFNEASGDQSYGGGLYCQGDYVIFKVGGLVSNNIAGSEGDTDGRGGGIYLDGCDMIWLAQDDESGPGALSDNTVHGGSANLGGAGGGGLFATGGAQVDLIGAHFTLFGDPISSRPLRIHNNLAQATSGESEIGLGSAVFAFGGGTRVSLDRTWIYANEAGRATFYARGGAEIIVERGNEVCHTPKNCSRVFDNSADPAVAFAHGFGNTIRFRRTIVSGNSSPAGSTVSSIFNIQGGTIEVDDSLIFGNSADAGFHILAESTHVLRVRRSTIADNDIARVFRISSDDTTFSLWDSIVHEPGADMALVTGDPTISIDCVVWHDDQLGGMRTLVADPLFADPPKGLYYLRPGSPAINYCEDLGQPFDLEWNPRGILHSGQSAEYGPVDLGAFEFPLMLFTDRFENDD